VLLSSQEINDELGTYAAGSTPMMAMDDSSYGMSDNSALVTPPACVGVVFGAEHRVYAESGFEEMRDQTFRPETYVVDDVIQPPYVVEQTVVVYATAQQAQAVLTSSQSEWNSCAKDAVTERIPPENSRDWVLGVVQRSGDLVTVPMAANSHIGPAACQQALGARDNVVVGARRCDYWEEPATTAFTGSTWPTNPEWASDDAERLAQLMLDRVVI
jgi:serine/threonine-protein kinase